MNYYNIQYSPKEKENLIQRIVIKKIKIYGYRTIKKHKSSLIPNSNSYFNFTPVHNKF